MEGTASSFKIKRAEVCEAKADWGRLPNTARIRQAGFAVDSEPMDGESIGLNLEKGFFLKLPCNLTQPKSLALVTI